MCHSNKTKFRLTIPLLLLGVIIAMNFPELRRYIRICSM